MPVQCTLTTDDHIEVSYVAQILETAGYGPVSFDKTKFSNPSPDLPLHGKITFRDPKDNRRIRELGILHAIGKDEDNNPHLSGDDYTYFTLGSGEPAERILAMLGEVFGGRFCNDADPTQDRLIEPAPAPRP